MTDVIEQKDDDIVPPEDFVDEVFGGYCAGCKPMTPAHWAIRAISYVVWCDSCLIEILDYRAKKRPPKSREDEGDEESHRD